MTKYNFKTKPFKHQLKALEKSQGKRCFAYFMEMGTGKTKVAIDDVVNLYLEKKIDTVVVIAPNSVYQNWINEINMHAGCDVNINTHKVDKNFVHELDKLNFYLFNLSYYSDSYG